ncbi:hypothetical protein [Acetobacter sp. DsW_063]|uniref:hypothetical protein n=1 Tax=Acetobacter sp. DsW_063 TaxID=1514894 RepID=UPI000A3CC0E2|nr:hypothetical protein [Acetobacter sp. DsW_063]OUJ16818.1 hypothetical protein HK28_09795 [Acetobacter sp. DsW_063]
MTWSKRKKYNEKPTGRLRHERLRLIRESEGSENYNQHEATAASQTRTTQRKKIGKIVTTRGTFPAQVEQMHFDPEFIVSNVTSLLSGAEHAQKNADTTAQAARVERDAFALKYRIKGLFFRN